MQPNRLTHKSLVLLGHAQVIIVVATSFFRQNRKMEAPPPIGADAEREKEMEDFLVALRDYQPIVRTLFSLNVLTIRFQLKLLSTI